LARGRDNMKLFDKFLQKYLRFKFLNKKKEDLIILNILEAYLTEKVLEGDESRREELANMQFQIEENKRFINFIEKNL
jgi:hypothetical protein